jgi:undecaprenyl-diphosphatase
MGTFLAVLLYFARTWVAMLTDLLRGVWRPAALIVVGTIPAVIAGALLQPRIETTFRDPRAVAAGLVLGSLVIAAAEIASRPRRDFAALGLADAVVIGAAQAVALFPGMSRSGMTISAGLFRSLRREDATRFAFVLGTPVMLAAGAKILLDARSAEGLFGNPGVLAAGFIVSFLSGLAAVAFLVRFLRANSLAVFILYRLVLASAIIVALWFGLL